MPCRDNGTGRRSGLKRVGASQAQTYVSPFFSITSNDIARSWRPNGVNIGGGIGINGLNCMGVPCDTRFSDEIRRIAWVQLLKLRKGEQ